MILNINDYHNIHTILQLNTTDTSYTLHFITILMKASILTPAIPNNQLVHNSRGVDFKDIITRLDSRYMRILSITYQNRKNSNSIDSFTTLFKLSETHESRTEQLLVHCYDIRTAERKDDRSIYNNKMI